jgi:hypothetical protein
LRIRCVEKKPASRVRIDASAQLLDTTRVRSTDPRLEGGGSGAAIALVTRTLWSKSAAADEQLCVQRRGIDCDPHDPRNAIHVRIVSE